MAWANRIVSYGTQKASLFKPHPLNFRRHPARQEKALSGSLQTLGWIDDVIVTARGVIIDGHERVEMALRNGDADVPFKVIDISEAEEAQALLSLDPIAALAQTDAGKVDELLRLVETDNTDVMQFLTDMAKEAGLDYGQTPEDAPGPQIDRAAELQVKWQTATGQLWEIGKHRLICGDCTDKAVVERLMQGEEAHALLNDPPYGMRLDADYSGMVNNLDFARVKGVKNGRKYNNVIGDGEDYDASPVLSMFGDVKEQFWFGADYYSTTLGDTMHSGAWLIWDKRLDDSADKMFGSCFEMLWSRQKHKRDILRHKWAGIFGTEHEPQRGRMHPNQKPVALYEDILTRYTDEGAIIADCYAGSGTTIIACERLGRQCRAIEISPAYVAVSLQRLADMGLEPRLVA